MLHYAFCYICYPEGIFPAVFCWISDCVYMQLPFIYKVDSSLSAFANFLPFCARLIISHKKYNGLGWAGLVGLPAVSPLSHQMGAMGPASKVVLVYSRTHLSVVLICSRDGVQQVKVLEYRSVRPTVIYLKILSPKLLGYL